MILFEKKEKLNKITFIFKGFECLSDEFRGIFQNKYLDGVICLTTTLELSFIDCRFRDLSTSSLFYTHSRRSPYYYFCQPSLTLYFIFPSNSTVCFIQSPLMTHMKTKSISGLPKCMQTVSRYFEN